MLYLYVSLLKLGESKDGARRERVGGKGYGQLTMMGEVQISLGDQSNYYLSTARNELGVIMAKSEAGNTMVPVSWKEFRDPVTGERESRKVAKPF